MRASLVLVLLAACAGSRPPAAAKPDTPDVAGLVDELCACTQPECMNAALDKLQPHLEGQDGAEVDRAKACFDHQMMVYGHRAIVDITRMTADRVCACTDTGCAVAAALEGAQAREQVPHIHEDSDEHRAADNAYEEEERRAAACYHRLPGAAAPAVGVANVVAFADAVCACQRQAACLDKAKADYQAASSDPATVLFLDPDVTHAHITRALSCGLEPAE
jgi:hypothetical protein